MIVENFLTYSSLISIELTIVVQFHIVAKKKTRVDSFNRYKSTIVRAFQRSLSSTQTTDVCGHKTNTNHYHNRKSNYENTMIRSHAVARNCCQSHVHSLLEVCAAQPNGTLKLYQAIAFLIDLEQQNNLVLIQNQ